MISSQSVRIIEAHLASVPHRIVRLDLPEGEVLIKRQRSRRHPLGHWLLNAIAGLAGAPVLKSVPNPGGSESQAIELKRLYQLRLAGVCVPEVLHVAPQYFVMRRVKAHDLVYHMRHDAQEALRVFEQGLLELNEVHRKQQCLSQAFARNMLLEHGNIVYIDFEDNPLQSMTLPQAQTRDWLCFLHSSVWGNKADPEALMATWMRLTPQISGACMNELVHAVNALVWMRHLSKRRKPWGRDMVTVQALAQFLYEWRQRAILPTTVQRINQE